MVYLVIAVKKILFFSILLLALFLRFYRLDKVPPSLFADEVDLGYQAYSFLKTGQDYFGNIFPVSFHSFADFRAPLYIYSAAGTIAAFGLNEWGVRLPAAIFGVLGVVAFFFLVLKISQNINYSLLATFVLAILPWHIHYSRAGFEVTAMFFLLTGGLWFFFQFLEKKSPLYFFISLVSFSLCFYTYATARLFIPLLGITALIIYGKKIFSVGLKSLGPVVIICFLILLPFLKDTVFGGGLHRFSYLNIFSDSNLKFEVDRGRLVDTVHNKEKEVGMSPPFFSYVFHNKPLSWSLEIINSYVSSLSFNFLFLTGDPNSRHGIGKMGVLLLVFLPFFILGLWGIFTQVEGRKEGLFSPKEALFFLLFFFLAPLPASITYDGETHATRLFFLVLPVTLFISSGIWTLLGWFKKKKIKLTVSLLVLVLIMMNFVYYLHLYYYHYPVGSEKFWHAGFKEAIRAVIKEDNGYDKVIFSNTYDPPLIFFLFWSEYSPQKFNASRILSPDYQWFEGKQIEKYYFGRLGTGFLDSYLPLQIKNNGIERTLILSRRNDFGGDLEKDVPFPLRLMQTFRLPSGEPILYLLRTKTFAEIKMEQDKIINIKKRQ